MTILLRLWKFLGQVMGDEDYTRYCEHLRSRHREREVPSARTFYLTRLKERYSRPTRCC